MEAVLYEDFGSHNTFLNMNNINQLKRKLTLDLDMGSGDGNGSGKPMSVIKKAKVASLNTPGSAAILLSPDVSKLALPTPELERFIINSTSTLPTPTPNQNQIFFPRNVTEEQEAYAQGFTEALNKLHGYTTASPIHNNNNIIMTTANSNISLSSNSLVNTSTAQALAVLNQDPQMQHLLPTMSMNNPKLVSMQPTSAPPPAYHDYSSDTSDDTMSESSCSNSTNSSSYAPGHMVVPTSSMLNSANATIPIAVTSANHSIVPHRLPDYQINQMTFGGATGSSGNIAAIPVSAAGYPQNSSSSPIPVLIKEEPQIVPNMSSPNPVTPIDMETQEQIKLERKRQRNRLAASKCRKRKLERISKLEDKVKQLKGENGELTNVLTKLKDTVCSLKQQVMDHVNSGCQMMIPPNLTTGF